MSSCPNKGALSKAFRSTLPWFDLRSALTSDAATQAWQMKTCKAPIRDKGPATSRVNISLVTIATLCVCLRFLARWRVAGSTFGWDDWTILAAWILVIPSTTMFQISSFSTLCYLRPNLPADLPQIVIHNGLGRDIWTVPFDNITIMFKVCRK